VNGFERRLVAAQLFSNDLSDMAIAHTGDCLRGREGFLATTKAIERLCPKDCHSARIRGKRDNDVVVHLDVDGRACSKPSCLDEAETFPRVVVEERMYRSNPA